MRLMLLLLLLFWSHPVEAKSCKVLEDISSEKDTLLVVSVQNTGIVSCVGNSQLRSFLITDSIAPECLRNLSLREKESSILLEQKEEMGKAIGYLTDANKLLQDRGDTLLGTIKTQEEIAAKQDTLNNLLKERLEYCEENSLSLWDKLIGAAGFFLGGSLLGVVVGASVF